MKSKVGSLWQEITKVIRWILSKPLLLRAALRVAYFLWKLLDDTEQK